MREKTFDILTIADTCVDLILDLGDVEPKFGQVEQWVPSYFLEMGGSACIFACQAAKLGLKVAILGRVGDDDFGRLMMKRMHESGVDLRYMQVDPTISTGLGIALSKPSGDRAILTYGGSLNAVYPKDISEEFLSQGKHLHYCSYYLQTNLLPHIVDIFRETKKLGLSLSLDTNWDPNGFWDGNLVSALSLVDLFFPNDQEAMLITRCSKIRDAEKILKELVPISAIKLGEKGARVITRSEQFTIPVNPILHPIDTIGAGDSFDAGFLAAWLRGLNLQSCAEIGNACGRATTLARGGIQGQLTHTAFPQLKLTR
jgi:ribokinase